jgi:hypothetical protein
MSRYLAYVSPAVGHVLPIVPGLLELQARGHQVHIRTAPSLVETLREAGLDASPVAPDVLTVPVTDYRATTDAERLAAGQVDLMERGRYDGPDLAAAIEDLRPDALLVDVNAYGARTVAEASGLPHATLMPTVIPNRGRGIPPYGLGLKPMGGPVGRVRDAVLMRLVIRTFGKAMLPGLNRLRTEAGLAPFTSPLQPFEPPYRVIALTSEPLEYPRDDLPDTGAWLNAETVRKIHELNPNTGVELLANEHNADPAFLGQIFDARPEVFAHNVETVPRIFKRIRPALRYERSLDVITQARNAGLITKSNLILGMGEEPEEVVQALNDLHDAGCDIITITQYLRPSPRHLPVARWVKPTEFVEFKEEAERIGFLGVLAGPLVRSSYRAGRLWAQSMVSKGRQIPAHLSHIAESADLGFAQAV